MGVLVQPLDERLDLEKNAGAAMGHLRAVSRGSRRGRRRCHHEILFRDTFFRNKTKGNASVGIMWGWWRGGEREPDVDCVVIVEDGTDVDVGCDVVT